MHCTGILILCHIVVSSYGIVVLSFPFLAVVSKVNLLVVTVHLLMSV